MLALWLCATAIIGAAGSRQPARPEDPPEAGMAIQDLSDAMQIKPQFNAFLNRVNADTDKLHNALEVESAKVGDLELEKQSLQGQMHNEKQRLTHELEVFKQKMIAKITDLKTTNRRLEETNMQLVSSNDKLASELEAEQGKKGLLVKKLKKMAYMFSRQQQNVQQIIQSNSMKLESEVTDDVKEVETATEDSSASPREIHRPAPRPAVDADTEELDDDEVTKIAGAEDGDSTLSAPTKPVAPVAQPVPPPAKVSQPQAPKQKMMNKIAVARPASTPVAPQKAPAPVVVAPAPKAALKIKASADDEQLKALRAEVENLEQGVSTDESAGPAPVGSMLHVAGHTRKSATTPVAQSSSVDTLQQVGGMLSAAMAASDDDSDA